MSHPFGDLVRQHLTRKHGLSQNRLAAGIDQDPAVISRMCRGDRLTGPYARERVVQIIAWFHDQGVLEKLVEADALLVAAGFAGLQGDLPGEADLLEVLHARKEWSPRGSAPPLPTLVVGREKAVEDLRARLTRGAGPATASSVQVLTAIRGWPGVGKTTLAAVLAHDYHVSETFPDGVLWTSLGPTPDLRGELIAWGRALGLDDDSLDLGLEEIACQLTALLKDRRRLLIVDDVWQAEHAVPFRVGGRGCAHLVTTRSPAVAHDLASTPENVYLLPVLSDSESLDLLGRLAPVVVARHLKQSRELVQELEGLPLALQVAGRLLHAEAVYGWGVQDLLAELREGVRLLESQAPADLVDLAGATIPSVAVLLKKSTDRLDAHTRDCFAYLGVFAPKPATFDLEDMKAVWEVPDPRPIARRLVERGLLEPVGSARVQMHALLVLLAKSLLTE